MLRSVTARYLSWQRRWAVQACDQADGQRRGEGPINIGNPTEFTMLELAKVVKEVVNPDAEIVFRENTADDPNRRKPDITKARAASHALLSRRRHFWSWRSASPITAQTLDRSKACHSSAILKLRLAFGQGACDGGAWAGSTLSEVQGLMCWGPERQLHCCEMFVPHDMTRDLWGHCAGEEGAGLGA